MARDRHDCPALGDAIEKLKSLGADVDAGNSTGTTPLMVACDNYSTWAARIFIKEGANIHARDHMNRTALTYTIFVGFEEYYYYPSTGSLDLMLELVRAAAKMDDYPEMPPFLFHPNDVITQDVEPPNVWYYSVVCAFGSDRLGLKTIGRLLKEAVLDTNLSLGSVQHILDLPLDLTPQPLLRILLRWVKRCVGTEEFAEVLKCIVERLIHMSNPAASDWQSRPDNWPSRSSRMLKMLMKFWGPDESRELLLE